MLPSTQSYQALRDIASLLCQDAPADDLIKNALDVVCKTVGLPSVAFAWRDDSCHCWSSSNPMPFDPQKAAESLFSQPSAPDKLINIDSEGCSALCLDVPMPNGYRAAFVFDSRPDADKFADLFAAVGAQLSLLLQKREYQMAAEAAREHVRQSLAEVSAIYEIGEAIDAYSVDQVLALIPEKAAAVMGAQACSLMLVEPDGRHLVIAANYGLPEEVVRGARISFGEGIAGKVAQTGEPYIIHDLEQDTRFTGTGVQPRPEVVSSMCVPLRDSNSNIQGVLTIRRHSPAERFTQDDLKLFSVFANQAALAISNAQLYSRLNHRIQELSNISELMRSISSTLDLDSVLNQIAESITEVVGFDRCCLYLLDAHTQEFKASIYRGFSIGEDIPASVPANEGVIGLAAKEKIPISTQIPASGKLSGLQMSLAAPIVVRGSSIGVVVVDNQISKRPIHPIAVELLSTFVNQAGIAIENARLYEAMEQKYAELNVLYEQSKTLGSAYGLDNAASILLDVALKGVECDGGFLIINDPHTGNPQIRVSHGLNENEIARISERVGTAPVASFLDSLRDPVAFPLHEGAAFAEEKFRQLESVVPEGTSAVFTPLVAEDVTVGILILFRKGEETFSANDQQLATIIVSHAAAVIKNAIAYEQRMRQSVMELSVLYEFSKRISSAPSLEEALDSILAIVEELVQCDESVIYAFDPEHGLVIPKAVRLANGAPCEVQAIPVDSDCVIGWAIRERKAIVSPDITKDHRFCPVGIAGDNVRSLMAIPLMVQDEVVGVLGVYGYRPGRYTEDDVRVLSIIASQGAAIYRELEALTALTSYTDNILSSIAAGVVTLDRDGTILTWNKAAESIVGIKAERVVGLHYSSLVNRLQIPKQDKDTLTNIIEGVFATGEVYQGYKIGFSPLYRDKIVVNMSVSQLEDSTGERLGLVCIFEDITKEIKMEDEFRRMGELAAVGQLAASIAHELRNPLSSIKGAAQFLQEQYNDHSVIVEFLSIIVEEVNGLNKLTTEFLEFAKPIDLELEKVDINEIVDKVLRLMALHLNDRKVEVVEKLGQNLPKINADRKQIDQVLKNIIINAIDAMPNGGTLNIQTKFTPVFGGSIELSISDTGVGIPPDKLDRIFLPFMTTKTKGTGLGLAVVQKIIENHNGHIEVQSVVGEGTTFRVLLPKGAE